MATGDIIVPELIYIFDIVFFDSNFVSHLLPPMPPSKKSSKKSASSTNKTQKRKADAVLTSQSSKKAHPDPNPAPIADSSKSQTNSLSSQPIANPPRKTHAGNRIVITDSDSDGNGAGSKNHRGESDDDSASKSDDKSSKEPLNSGDELGIFLVRSIVLWGLHVSFILEKLRKDWTAPIYAFHKPVPDIGYEEGRRFHTFHCAAKGCKKTIH